MPLRGNPTIVVNVKTGDPFDMFIGRPSKWGNPFVLGKDGPRKAVIAKYRKWLSTQGHLMNSIWELSGKRLGCYCWPSNCHGDVLAEYCNCDPHQLYGMQGIWDCFTWPPRPALSPQEVEYLFDDGSVLVGQSRRAHWNHGGDLFAAPLEQPLIDINEERAIAWRKIGSTGPAAAIRESQLLFAGAR